MLTLSIQRNIYSTCNWIRNRPATPSTYLTHPNPCTIEDCSPTQTQATHLVAGEAGASCLQHLCCIAHTFLVEVAHTHCLCQTLSNSNTHSTQTTRWYLARQAQAHPHDPQLLLLPGDLPAWDKVSRHGSQCYAMVWTILAAQ